MLVERADVLVVGLLELRLGLRDGKVIGDAGVEALLGLGELFLGEIDVGLSRVNELGCGLDIEDGVADVCVDLLDLVGEPCLGLVKLRVCDVTLAAGLG